MAKPLNVRPDGPEGLEDLGGGLLPQVAEGVNLQPDEQGVHRRNGQGIPSQLLEGGQEGVKAGHKAAALLLAPGMLRLVPQGGLQLRKAPGLGKADLVKPRLLVGLHKFIVGQYLWLLAPHRHYADHLGRDGGGLIAFQNAYPLVSLLDIEAPQVFVADHRIPDPLVPQVGLAKVDPLGGKFSVHVQQGHKVGGKGGAPPLRLGPHNLVQGDFRQPQLHLSRCHAFLQDFIQHLGIGVAPPQDAAFVGFAPPLLGAAVLLCRFLTAHCSNLLLAFTGLTESPPCRSRGGSCASGSSPRTPPAECGSAAPRRRRSATPLPSPPW